MKRINILLLILVLSLCCSCKKETETFLEESIENTEILSAESLEYYLELNGQDSADAFKKNQKITGDWEIFTYNEISVNIQKYVTYNKIIFLGDLCVGLEFSSEEEAYEAVEILNSESFSYFVKGKFAFPTYFGCFVFFYGYNEITYDEKLGNYIENNGKKILLQIAPDYPAENGTLKIEGVNGIVHFGIATHKELNFKKVVIGKDIEILYFGSLALRNFEVLEFEGNIQVINGKMTPHNETFKYTIIPSSVVYVGHYAFSEGDIFCEHSSKPDAWDSEFVTGNAKVYWASEWEYDENGVPQPILGAPETV